MEFAGGVSAATLGYITHGIKGARYGYRLYKNTRKMAPTPSTKRKRSSSSYKAGYDSKHQSKRPNVFRGKLVSRPKPIRFKRHSKSRHIPTMNVREAIHSSVNESHIHLNLAKKHKKPHKTLGAWRLHSGYSQYVLSVAGEQTYFELAYLAQPNNLFATGLTATVSPTLTTNIGVAQMNPYLTNTGSAILASTVTPLEDRFMLRSMSLQTSMSNLSGVGCVIDLYVVTPKMTTNTSPASAVNGGFQNEAFGQAAANQPNAGSVTAGAVAGYENLVDPHTYPMESPLFKKMYKVLNVQHIVLAGSETHIYNLNITLDKVVKKDQNFVYSTQGTNNVANQTIIVFGLIRGQVVDDTTAGAGLDIATYGQAKVGMVTQVKYHASAVTGNAARLNTNRALINVPFGAALAKQTLTDVVDNPVTVAAITTA